MAAHLGAETGAEALMPFRDIYQIRGRSVGGVYAIMCLANRRIWVGSSFNIGIRWTSHKNALARGCGAVKMRSDWDRYGVEEFRLIVLEVVPTPRDGALAQVEQVWMDYFAKQLGPLLYNTHLMARRSDLPLPVYNP